jgi:putative oxidoreductase
MRKSFLKKYGALIDFAFLALIVGAVGIAKLIGVPVVHQSFGVLGLPSWFGYFIGAAEVAGAVGLFIAQLSGLAAAGLAIIGARAVYFHLINPPFRKAFRPMSCWFWRFSSRYSAARPRPNAKGSIDRPKRAR